MSSGPPKPVILIVPGSFSPASLYHPLVDGLKANGFDAVVYELPSASRKPPEHAAILAEDAMFFNGVLTSICDSGRDVVVLGHSYGGFVVTECVQGLTARKGSGGRVVGLIYVTALVPLEGDSLAKLMADQNLAFIKSDGDFLYHDSPEDTARVVFSDLPSERGMELAKGMPYQSGPSFQSGSRYTGYKDVDGAAYVFCTQDKCLFPEFQKQMIENIRSGGKPIKVYDMDCGHCPNVSQPETLAELVKEIIGAQFM